MEKIKIKLEKVENENYLVYVDGFALLKLENNGKACPEQYDLVDLLRNTVVGYIRVRGGYFSCSIMPDWVEVYGEDIDDGNGFEGRFVTEDERIIKLSKGIKEIVKILRERQHNIDISHKNMKLFIRKV